MKFGLKWVHMARYELILRLDGALWLTIIFKPLLTPKKAFTIQFESYFWMFVTENVSMIWNVTSTIEYKQFKHDKNVWGLALGLLLNVTARQGIYKCCVNWRRH